MQIIGFGWAIREVQPNQASFGAFLSCLERPNHWPSIHIQGQLIGIGTHESSTAMESYLDIWRKFSNMTYIRLEIYNPKSWQGTPSDKPTWLTFIYCIVVVQKIHKKHCWSRSLHNMDAWLHMPTYGIASNHDIMSRDIMFNVLCEFPVLPP
jgi:hypothetical protein